MRVDAYLRTSAPHIFAAGDITGRLLLVPEAIHDGFVAATNAVQDATMTIGNRVSPIGSFTDPEYAQVGLTETKAREKHDIVTAIVRFNSTTRTIIDGRTAGFCKLIVERATYKILGCHVVGERAIDITQVAAVAIAGGMRVDELARVPLCVSHLRRDPRSRGGERDSPAQSESRLARSTERSTFGVRSACIRASLGAADF